MISLVTPLEMTTPKHIETDVDQIGRKLADHDLTDIPLYRSTQSNLLSPLRDFPSSALSEIGPDKQGLLKIRFKGFFKDSWKTLQVKLTDDKLTIYKVNPIDSRKTRKPLGRILSY